MQLDDVMPRWHRRERHAIRLAASPAAVQSALEKLTWEEVPVFRVLLFVRSLGWGRLRRSGRVLDTFRGAGFVELARTPEELVFGGLAGAGGRSLETAPDTFAAFDSPGHIKIAMNFRYADGVLSTETRVLGTDPRARRRFAVYWFVIRPFSGLIRRSWLRAVRRRCQRTAAPGLASVPADGGAGAGVGAGAGASGGVREARLSRLAGGDMARASRVVRALRCTGYGRIPPVATGRGAAW